MKQIGTSKFDKIILVKPGEASSVSSWLNFEIRMEIRIELLSPSGLAMLVDNSG